MKPVKWGVLSTARIGVKQVIPAMMKSLLCEIIAIASRSEAGAREAAGALGIPRAYGSYQALLADADVEAVYIPVPNHMHVPLAIEALDAGKHVLCEKPLALNAAEAEKLMAARKRSGCLALEAFMVRHHPQWQRAREIVRTGTLGDLRLIQSTFSFYNANPQDIRNRPETGGGALYDIGVYPLTAARYFFGAEPKRVLGLMKRDAAFGTDVLTSAILDYEDAMAVFAVSTQMVPYQRLQIFGHRKRLEIEIPFNAPADAETVIKLDDGSQLADASAQGETIDACDQYRLQGEQFSRYVRGKAKPEFPLEDSAALMRIIDALFASAETSQWVEL